MWWCRDQEGVWHDWVPSWAQLLKGPFLSKSAPCPLGEGVGPSSLHTAKGWSKASSVRAKKRAIGWIFKLLLGFTASGPTRAKQAPGGPQVGYAGSHTGCVTVNAKIFPDRLRLTKALLQSKGDGRDVWRWLCLSLWVWGYSLWPKLRDNCP